MLSEEIIKEIKHIELKAGHLATQVLAGEYLSIFRGLGQEFEKVREYHPGDPIRLIDWNVIELALHFLILCAYVLVLLLSISVLLRH